jgi:hypothetical protein
VEPSTALGAIYLFIYLPLVGWLYGRQRRWYGLAGWALVMGGLLLAFGGAGDRFAWGGLFWLFIAAFGVLLLAMDYFRVR